MAILVSLDIKCIVQQVVFVVHLEHAATLALGASSRSFPGGVGLESFVVVRPDYKVALQYFCC